MTGLIITKSVAAAALAALEVLKKDASSFEGADGVGLSRHVLSSGKLQSVGGAWLYKDGSVCVTRGQYGEDGELLGSQDERHDSIEAFAIAYGLRDDGDFPLGNACDLSGEGSCEACQ